MNAEGTHGTVNPAEEAEAIGRRLAGVKRRVIVLSGKGGVGKSTVAVLQAEPR